MRSAPASSAAITVSGVDRPQILTSTDMVQFEACRDAPCRRGGISAAGDRPADHQDVGAVFECRARGRDPLLVLGFRICGTDAGNDREEVWRRGRLDSAYVLGAADDAIEPAPLGECRE